MCDIAFRVRSLGSAILRSRSNVIMCAPVEMHSLNEYASGVPDTHLPKVSVPYKSADRKDPGRGSDGPQDASKCPIRASFLSFAP